MYRHPQSQIDNQADCSNFLADYLVIQTESHFYNNLTSVYYFTFGFYIRYGTKNLPSISYEDIIKSVIGGTNFVVFFFFF